MNKHSRNNIKANFQHLILNKTSLSSHLPKNQPLIDIQRIAHSKQYHPTKNNQLQQETNYLLEAVEKHERYYLRKMELQQEKYLNHFKIMQRTLQDECSAGLFHINSCIEDIRQLFRCKRTQIKSKKQHLERRVETSMDQKLEELRKQTTFQAILFQVHLSDLTTFRQEIQKYTMSPWQKPIVSSVRSDVDQFRASNSRCSQELRQSLVVKEEATQTEFIAPLDEEQALEDSSNDMLCCEEELGRRISNTSRRRRRYAVGRRDVIKEQEEWEQGSSLVSESEVLGEC